MVFFLVLGVVSVTLFGVAGNNASLWYLRVASNGVFLSMHNVFYGFVAYCL